jgi:hypothetical protein
VTTDLRYIDAESKTAAQVLTILLTTYYLLLTSTPRVRQPRRCSLYLHYTTRVLFACLLTYVYYRAGNLERGDEVQV